MWLLMAACKNLLCVNSFTEANQTTCLSSLKTNWDGRRLQMEELALFFIFVFEQEGDTENTADPKTHFET